MTTRTKCFYGEVGELADVEGGFGRLGTEICSVIYK